MNIVGNAANAAGGDNPSKREGFVNIPGEAINLADFVVRPETAGAAFFSYCDYRPLFAEPIAFRKAVNTFFTRWSNERITRLCVFSSPAGAIAGELSMRMGGLPIIFFNRGTRYEPDGDAATQKIALVRNEFSSRDRVLFIHDVLSHGKYLVKARDAVERMGATVVGLAVIAEVEMLGGKKEFGRPVSALVQIVHD